MASEPHGLNEPSDPTPEVGAETDVSRLGEDFPKPAHEQTADEDAQVADWDRIAASEGFKILLKAKVRFILPATIFFIVYYFALPVLVGYAPEFMAKKVWGQVNIAYLFALSQFFMAWTLAWLYVRAAGRFDGMAKEIVTNATKPQGGK